MAEFVFEATGTTWKVEIEKKSRKKTDSLSREVRARIEGFEARYSRFRNGSLPDIAKREPVEWEVERDAKAMFDLYFELEKISDGLVTPLAGAALEATGYDKDYTFRQKPAAKYKRLAEVCEYAYPHLRTREAASFDFGALGKGQIIDLVVDFLREEGVEKFCVEAGGDLRHFTRDGRKIRVGLEDPTDQSQAVGMIEIGNESICGSAGNRRRWGMYHHILNPKTGKPAEIWLASWAVADRAVEADAMATAVYFVSVEKLKAKYKFEYALLNPDWSVRKSSERFKFFTK